MESIITHQEQRNSNRGKTISVIVHIALILLALLPLLHYPTPPPGQEGILVNLGLPDMGEGDDNAGPTAPAEPEVEEEEAPEVEEEEALPEPEPEEVEPEPVPDKEVVKTDNSKEIALKREKEKERKKQEEADRKKKAEADAKKRAEAEAKRKAAADAKRKADAEAKQKAEADKLKSDIGGLFGDGGGKGNTGKPGNQGDPNGDPNASNLEGISTGSGKVGGGLGSRGVLKSPRVTENSQKAGTVVVSVCVDANGKVLSAQYTQRGSTTGDSQLVKAAIRNAKLWGFSKGSVDKQCGTISYNFKVK